MPAGSIVRYGCVMPRTATHAIAYKGDSGVGGGGGEPRGGRCEPASGQQRVQIGRGRHMLYKDLP